MFPHTGINAVSWTRPYARSRRSQKCAGTRVGWISSAPAYGANAWRMPVSVAAVMLSTRELQGESPRLRDGHGGNSWGGMSGAGVKATVEQGAACDAFAAGADLAPVAGAGTGKRRRWC